MGQLSKTLIVVGPICSGKSTIANRISEEYKIPIASFGAYLNNYSSWNLLPTDRTSLQNLGEKFIVESPQSFLNKVIGFTNSVTNTMIFEGVRHRAIYDLIHSISEHTLSIFIDQPYEVRLQRFLKRIKIVDTCNSEEHFKLINQHPVEQETIKLKADCDIIVDDYDDSNLQMKLKSFIGK